METSALSPTVTTKCVPLNKTPHLPNSLPKAAPIHKLEVTKCRTPVFSHLRHTSRWTLTPTS